MDPVTIILIILFVATLLTAWPHPYGAPGLALVVAILILLHILKKI